MALIPEPLAGGQKLDTLKKLQVRSNDALQRWLKEKEVDTSGWGTLDGTKSVEWLYKEIKGDESELELWKCSSGEVKPVRVTHVLRAKVTSPEAYRRNLFLFNTWQQFGHDGKMRVRNGLLSEKLTIAEMPFESHMHEICQRAVTEEEMQRVVDAAFRIDKNGAPIEFDEAYVCPIEVVEAHLVDHTIEVEESKSYPGLLTLYHLYTVDILCQNLPVVDFNTLEFTHRDLTDESGGERKLKYVHAWVWLQWSQIKRYLFEGSILKERKQKGSFQDSETLRGWLGQFNLDLESWGTGKHRNVKSLLAELENESAHLEVWGRQDGVPLVMRVVHVMQVRLQSSDSRLAGQFLVQKWEQNEALDVVYVERPFSKKIKVTQVQDAAVLSDMAVSAVKEELNYIADSFFDFEEDFKLEELDKSGVDPQHVEYLRSWYDMEESKSFKGVFTMYHMYAFSMQCHNLPKSSFTSVHRSGDGSLTRTCWQWSTWEETASVVNARQAKMERADAQRCQDLEVPVSTLSQLASAVNAVVEKAPKESVMDALRENLALLEKEMCKIRDLDEGGDNLARMLPPSMISKLAGQSIAPSSMLQQAHRWGAAEQLFNE